MSGLLDFCVEAPISELRRRRSTATQKCWRSSARCTPNAKALASSVIDANTRTPIGGAHPAHCQRSFAGALVWATVAAGPSR